MFLHIGVPVNDVVTQFGLFVCMPLASMLIFKLASKSPPPTPPAGSSQAHPMEPHSGQKAGRLILLTFPFSLQCDSLPPARARTTHAYLQTDLSLHYRACLLPLALACKGETGLQAFLLLRLPQFCVVHDVYTDYARDIKGVS